MLAILGAIRRRDLHSLVGGLVDNHTLAGLVHVVVQAKVSSYSVDQHPVIGGHLGELQIVVSARRR